MHHDIPHGTEHPHGTQDNLHGTHDIPTVLKISPTFIMVSPHGTEHPHGTQDIPHGTQDIPHGTHDIPHGTEHPQGTEHPPRYCTHIIPGVNGCKMGVKCLAI